MQNLAGPEAFVSVSAKTVTGVTKSIQARRASECTDRQLPEDALACAASLYFNCFFLDPLGLSVSKVDGVFSLKRANGSH